ncbi:hypothetical protein AB162_381 [Candidatus Palibaumannia cicadellinicola]|uniref:Uncharacterized protein n=1 Tax=Candidatus Palibaumannia cicadellinicola TaxID=186490 RepID=A0A0K2BLA2_9GAMM|nr:hypothetical protein AB162_381 [Candidatus Baumannia cicadellinicola]
MLRLVLFSYINYKQFAPDTLLKQAYYLNTGLKTSNLIIIN